MTERAVRRATADEIPALVRTLAGAFQDDPLFSWFVPGDERRRRALPRFFRALLQKVYIARGETYTTDGIDGAAVWSPPGTWKLSIGRQLRLGPALARAVGGRLSTMSQTLTMLERRHPSEPHWYLAYLGTAPAMQGKGVGGSLLSDMTARCDREGLPAYLEASSVGSRALYFRHGFKEVEEVTFRDGPPLWRMWREPQPV